MTQLVAGVNLAREINPGDQLGHADLARKRSAAVEQRGKPPLDAGPRSNRAELDEKPSGAGFARRSPVAYGEPAKTACDIPQQQRVAQLACGDGADFPRQVEAVVKRAGAPL